jgi:hypothetical protein
MRKAAKKIKHLLHSKKAKGPNSIIKRALKKSNSIKTHFTGFVIENPLKTSGILAVGLVAISSFLFGYLKRR